ncbi:hypothetical protein ONE63_011405 [Megalurothrips usitatus]|uniref:Deoxynucleoside kinase domain-containing protein n=1 Tax=Megalurothrips usitatus TaxID=439358 RepID=A0AAV7X2J1_9NEOP|nr:hypothetical protein ONE63_011405 [Megalurothrips usitatus]
MSLEAAALLVAVVAGLWWLAAGWARPPAVVYLEGNIGVGKSTVLRLLGGDARLQVVPEPLAAWQDVGGLNMLQLYLQDLGRWAYVFHTLALVTTWEAQRRQRRAVQVAERSVHSALRLFAALQRQDGLLGEPHMAVLHRVARTLLSEMPRREVFVYLRAPPEVAYRRARARARPEDAPLPREYFRRLHDRLEAWLLHEEHSPVWVVDADRESAEVAAEVRAIADLLLQR